MPQLPLTQFIKQAQMLNLSDADITTSLVKAGWNQKDIDATFAELKTLTPPASPLTVPTLSVPAPVHTSLWDSFEHILLFISLYIMATSLGLVLHTYIDQWFPEFSVYTNHYNNSSYKNTFLLMSLASLIVSFPLFAFFFLDIHKRTLKNTGIRRNTSRKVLIYLTLVVTFIVMLMSLISLVFGLLNGNVNLNFLCKFLVTVAISSLIFGYYLTQVKEDRKQ
jgi:hypothetical protein